MGIKKTPLTVAVIVATLGLTGCEWDNSDKYKDQDIPGQNFGTIPIRGQAGTTDGYYKNAEVCADLNRNGRCDAGEPKTDTGTGGEFELSIPDDSPGQVDLIVTTKPGITVNEGTGETVMTPDSQKVPVDTGGGNVDVTVQNPKGPPEENPLGKEITGYVLSGNGYISGAKVCIDQNRNDECDSDERTDTTNENGKFSLGRAASDDNFNMVAEIAAGESINQTSNETETHRYTLRSPFDHKKTVQTISHLTELAGLAASKMSPPDTESAATIIAGRLGTRGDPLADYLDNQQNKDPLTTETSLRLERISSALNELENQILGALTPTDWSSSGLSYKELNRRISEQLADSLPSIVRGVDDILDLNAPFTPEEFLSDTKYDKYKNKPNLTPKSLAVLDLEERISLAEDDNPYFYMDGYQTKALPDSEVIKLTIYPNPTESGTVHYEAVRDIMVETDLDSGTIDAFLTLPRYYEFQGVHPYTAPNKKVWCNRTTGFFPQRCSFINLSPESHRAITWTGSAWRAGDIGKGLASERVLSQGFNGKEIIAAPKNGGLTSLISFRDFDLSGLRATTVIDTLFAGQIPKRIPYDHNAQRLMAAGSKAWVYKEEIIEPLIASNWFYEGHDDTETTCNGPSQPSVSEVSSCNLTYGHATPGQPAKTLDDLTYPAGTLNSAFTGSLSGNHATGAIPVHGPGSARYVMRLFGSNGADAGRIQIDRKASSGNTWEIASSSGTWEKVNNSLPHIKLDLPDAYSFPAARLHFKAGAPVLYELNGYVRHGWRTPKKLDTESLIGRAPVQFVINRPALNSIHNVLKDMGILWRHPYFVEEGMTLPWPM